MSALGPRPTPRDLRAASPLTEVHRPRARQAVDVVGAPGYDPIRTTGPRRETCYFAAIAAAAPAIMAALVLLAIRTARWFVRRRRARAAPFPDPLVDIGLY